MTSENTAPVSERGEHQWLIDWLKAAAAELEGSLWVDAEMFVAHQVALDEI